MGFHCPSCIGPTRSRQVRTSWESPTQNHLRQTQSSIAIRIVIALNVAAFLLVLGTGGDLSRGGGDTFVDFGLIGFGCRGFIIGQGCIGPLGVEEGEWWRLGTSAFLHAGLLHLVFNMFLAWMLGNPLERLHGPIRFLGLYIGSLAAGSLGVLLVSPRSLTVGASGAVFGLMGATLVHQYRRGINPWSSGIGTLVVVNLIFTFGRPGISIGGHVGGLLGGALLAWILDGADKKGLSKRMGTSFTWVFTFVCLVACLWASANWQNPILS